MTKSLFEKCFAYGSGGIEEKAELLEKELKRNPPSYYEGLQMVLLEGVKPVTKVRTPSGEVRDMLMFGSNSFLNLNHHPRVLEAGRRAAERFGSGNGSPPLYAGQTVIHEELEEELARFCGTEAAVLFPAGYSGNLGVLSGLCRSGDTICCDADNHASLFDGVRLSGATFLPYPHLKPRRLEQRLLQREASDHSPSSGGPSPLSGHGEKTETGKNSGGLLIVSDGVFSMEGSLAPVDELVRLKERFGAFLMIDDAHGFWAVGPDGAGTAACFGLRDKVDLHYGTFSKALGQTGGFAAGKKSVINYLRYYARSCFFSSGIAAVSAAEILESVRIVREEPEHLERLRRNRDFFQKELEDAGFNTLNSRSAILPLLVGDEEKLGLFQKDLFRAGIFSNIGTTPAVSARKCRLRLNVMATHSREQLARAAEILLEIGKKYEIV